MRPKNKKKKCRICGAKVKSNMRFCALCARDRKKAKAEEAK